MQYPLYEFYKNRSLTLEQVIDHYVTRFYARKYNGKDVLKVHTKVRESSKIKNLCGQSATRRIAPNYIDFASTINEMIWFIFKSNMTQALGVLFAALYWDDKINSVYHLKSADDLKDDIIKVFKKFSIYEEMTESEFMEDNSKAHEPTSSTMSDKTNERRETEREGEKTTKTDFSKTNNKAIKDNTWDIRDNYDFNESFKKHALTILILRQGVEFRYFASQNAYSPMWSYVINSKMSLKENCPSGAEPFVWIMNHYENREDFCWLLEILDEQIAHLWVESMKDPIELIHDIQRFVPSFKLKNDPQSVKTLLAWSWIDMHAILYFIDYCLKPQNKSAFSNKEVKTLQNCSTLEDLIQRYRSDFSLVIDTQKEMNKNESSREMYGKATTAEIAPIRQEDFAWSIHTIDNLNVEDRGTLFSIIVFLSERDYFGGIYHKKDVSNLLNEYRHILQLTEKQTNEYINYSIIYHLLKLKKISYYPEINRFIYLCVKLLDILDYDEKALAFFYEILESVKYTKEVFLIFLENHQIALQFPFFVKICNNETNDKIDPYVNARLPHFLNQDGSFHSVLYWSLYTVSSLKLDQRISMYWGVNSISYLYDNNKNKRRKKQAIQIVDCYKKILKLTDDQVKNISNKKCENDSLYIDNLKSISNKSEVERFLFCCVKISNLSYNQKTVVFFKDLLKAVGYPIEELRKMLVKIDNKLQHFIFETERILVETKADEHLLSTQVKDNESTNSWTDEFGVKYSTDKKRLYHAHEYVKNYMIKEGTEIICDGAFSNLDFEEYDYESIIAKGLTPYDFAIYVSELTSVSIPSSVIVIGKGVFDYCNKLKTIYVPKGEKKRFELLLPDYKDIIVEGDMPVDVNKDMANIIIDEFGVRYSADKTILLKVPKNIKKYSIEKGVRTIANAAFSNCEQLKSVILPESVTEIGHYAFANCSSIFSFAIPNNVKCMGNGVFVDCIELSSIRLPKLSTIENDVFQGCNKLNSVFVPIGEKYKYEQLLSEHDVSITEYNPNDTEDVKILDTILHGILDKDGVLYDFEGKLLISATSQLNNYCIKYGTIEIGHEAFKPNRWKVDSFIHGTLSLPDSIQIIGDAAFANNTGLKRINIPESVTFSHLENPFAGCINLHNIEWNTIYAIKEGTLVFNQKRTALVACLGWYYVDGILESWPFMAFAKSHGRVKTGYFSSVDKNTGEEKNFKSLIFDDPTDNKTIKCYVGFSSKLGEISDEEIIARKNDLIVVQSHEGKYSLCQKGTDKIFPDKIVELPEGLESIAADAFKGNEYLEEISLPKSIKTIGKDAFIGCSALIKINIPQGTLSKFKELLPEWKAILHEVRDVDDLPF